MRTTISKSFLDGFVKALDLFGTKEWPDLSNDKEKDYMALRGDWDNVGKSIQRETRNFRDKRF